MEQTLPLMLRSQVRKTPNLVAQYAKNGGGQFISKTYQRFYDEIRCAAAGLLALGVKRGDHIGIVSDNRQEWIVSDFAVLAVGAVDVPRGRDATEQELVYVLGAVECALSFAENQKQVMKILSRRGELPALRLILTYDDVDGETLSAAASGGIEILPYREMLDLGKKRRLADPGEVEEEMEKGRRDDLATIIFTSGTTGEPKGVMLTHGNFLHQLPSFPLVFDAKPGDIWLSVLPVWHVFERVIEYIIFYMSGGIAYSKPIASVLLADFQAVRPHWMVSVPRIWESIMDWAKRYVKQKGGLVKSSFNFFVYWAVMYNYFRDLTFGLIPNFHGRLRVIDAVSGFIPWLLLAPLKGLGYLLVFRRIRWKLGGRFKAGMSGGGSLPSRADHFLNAMGIRLQEGYGLTETSPIISMRQYRKARMGTVGQVFPDTEVRIVDGRGRVLSPGHNGHIQVRGGQVMRGYYKKPEATAAILSADGWLDTGDIGMLTHDNELKITGRAKDTIVLRGGENVEPVPIEHKLRESPWISQCMVVGQDQKYLAALIVPDQAAVMAFAEENHIPIVDYENLLQQPEINEVIANETADLVGPRTGFKPFERVFKFRLVPKPFEPGKELSPKQELLRQRIAAAYAREIHALFKDR
jgi:long-chain acyl-CoA synthetase